MRQKGFTLVELAIVLMIIGLLIGGILKGQELIQNARITTTIRQLKSYDAATLTFIDAYGGKPGDITNPSTRLPNCSAANCNIAGNGDNSIGTTAGWGDENGTYWLHLAAANLITGVDTSGTWPVQPYQSSLFARLPIGGNVMIYSFAIAPGASTAFPQGVSGPYYYLASTSITAAPVGSIPVNILARLDAKMDDNKPLNGEVMAYFSCVTDGSTAYPNTTTPCVAIFKTGF